MQPSAYELTWSKKIPNMTEKYAEANYWWSIRLCGEGLDMCSWDTELLSIQIARVESDKRGNWDGK